MNIKKKYYYTFEAKFPFGEFGPVKVRVIEPDFDPLTKLQTITTTVLNVAPEEENYASLMKILSETWNLPNEKTLGMGILTHHADTIKVWTLTELCPININFGYLDESNSYTCDIEITWKFKDKINQDGFTNN